MIATDEPLWRRALVSRQAEQLRQTNRTAASRLALFLLLRRVGADVGLVEIHGWSRALQGRAYLWAIARDLGREDQPEPWRL